MHAIISDKCTDDVKVTKVWWVDGFHFGLGER